MLTNKGDTMNDCICMEPEQVKVIFFTEKDENGADIQDLQFATSGSACADIRCKSDVTIFPNTTEMIATGLYVAIPDGYEMQIRPRSGISAKTSLIFKNTIGTIDSDYRNEIFVLWYNLGVTAIKFKKFDRIAQIKIEKVTPTIYESVTTLEELKLIGHNRGGGFGSTGLQ